MVVIYGTMDGTLCGILYNIIDGIIDETEQYDGWATFDQKELHINRVNDIPTPKQNDQSDSFGDQMHLEVEEDARNHIGIGDEDTQRNGEDQDDYMDHTESNGGHDEEDSPNRWVNL